MDKNNIINIIAREEIARKSKGLFKDVFFDLNEKVKEYITKEANKTAIFLKKEISKYMEEKKLKGDIDLKLGKFRGHPYVSTARLIVLPVKPFKNDKDQRIAALLKDIQEKYSPKYQFKEITENGAAVFNIR